MHEILYPPPTSVTESRSKKRRKIPTKDENRASQEAEKRQRKVQNRTNVGVGRDRKKI